MPDTVPTSAPGLIGAMRQFHGALSTAAGKAASGLTDAQFAELERGAGALEERVAARARAKAAYGAAVAAVEGEQRTQEGVFRPLRNQATAAPGMTDALRAEAGLPARDGARAPADAAVPTIADLDASLRPSGAVHLDWSGPTGSVRYEVFAQDAAEGAWRLIGSATATEYTDREARPGVERRYSVVALRGERRGERSNVEAVYAPGGPG